MEYLSTIKIYEGHFSNNSSTFKIIYLTFSEPKRILIRIFLNLIDGDSIQHDLPEGSKTLNPESLSKTLIKIDCSRNNFNSQLNLVLMASEAAISLNCLIRILEASSYDCFLNNF